MILTTRKCRKIQRQRFEEKLGKQTRIRIILTKNNKQGK